MGPIQVKCSCGEDNCKEWAIIELQGVVEPQSQQPHLNLQNLRIGLLCRPSSQETYTLTIGYHELTGSKVTLKKPLLVLKKLKHYDEDESTSSKLSPSKVELDVIGIIRQKILFKTRPRALITSTKKV
ncbi:Chromosome transmission fidelity protein 8-like protein [Bienertia sinuspersici]